MVKTTRVTIHRNGKKITYTRRITQKQIRAAKQNIKKARKAWMNMSSKARRKAMPAKTKNPPKKYKVGQYMALDVGRPKRHYIFVKKVAYGWKKVKPPKGVKTEKVKLKNGRTAKLVPLKELQKHIARARKAWMQMSSTARKRAMPQRKGRKGYVAKKVTRRHWKTGKKYTTTVWVKKK